ncbi:MAG: hypothetical protein NC541_02985 [bacterium]|nr:hypothetical protein [bacterium]
MRHKNFLYNNLIGLRLLCKIFPKSIFFYSALQMLHGASWVLQVVSVQYFLDGILENEGGFSGLVLKILLLGASCAFAQIMNGVINCYGQILNRKAAKETNKLLFRAIDRKEALSFEYAEELDQINKAVRGSEGVFWVSTTVLDILFFYGFYFVLMSWYLFSLAPVLSVSTILIFLPNVLARLLHMISFERLENEAAPVRRKMEYYADCIVGKEYYKETRLLGCGGFFFDKYRKMQKKLNRLHFQIQLRKETINFCINVFTVAAYGVIIAMLVRYVLTDRISVGAFAAVFAALREFYGFMDEVISERLAVAVENMAAVKNYLAFLKEDPGERKQIKLPERFEIRLEHVSFAYPQPETGEQKFVLSDIDLQIP